MMPLDMGIIHRHLIAAALAVAVATPAAAQSIRTGKTAGGIAYDVQGSGPALVLITGSNLDRRL
ncbi:MAG: hypothetical protein K2Y23_12460 [Cyanobacteria bacterium]|nr:hypothetical protein [Cyanobacteriota bacterium]